MGAPRALEPCFKHVLIDVQLAHTALASVVRLPASATTGPAPHTLVLRTRSFDVHTLSFARSDTAEGVWESLRALCTGVAMGASSVLLARANPRR